VNILYEAKHLTWWIRIPFFVCALSALLCVVFPSTDSDLRMGAPSSNGTIMYMRYVIVKFNGLDPFRGF
jgi:hypothetical protein